MVGHVLAADNAKDIAAIGDLNAQSTFYLPDVFVEITAEAGQPLIVSREQTEFELLKFRVQSRLLRLSNPSLWSNLEQV